MPKHHDSLRESIFMCSRAITCRFGVHHVAASGVVKHIPNDGHSCAVLCGSDPESWDACGGSSRFGRRPWRIDQTCDVHVSHFVCMLCWTCRGSPFRQSRAERIAVAVLQFKWHTPGTSFPLRPGLRKVLQGRLQYDYRTSC